MPGKIVSNLKKAGTANPLFLLDEIDKLGQDFRGDPASALLEVLDPEQNAKFQDHYLELDIDLSDVMFVCTANSLNLPQPLLDRMEIIRLEGYTEDEKVEIAERHLVAKQVEAHGLKKGEFELTEPALRDLIRYYTREAGVRTLEREVARLARKSLRRILEGKESKVTITPKTWPICRCPQIPPWRFRRGEPGRRGDGSGLDRSGRRAAHHRKRDGAGKGAVKTTGKLGEVMSESVQMAFSFVKARARLWHQALDLQPQGSAHPLARRRCAQGWPFGGHRHGHGHGFHADGHSGARRCGDDRRGDAAWPRAGHRRSQGKAAGRAARWHQDRADPRGEPQGSGRNPHQYPRGDGDRAGGPCR
jgi:ATP-dependent Lon protease